MAQDDVRKHSMVIIGGSAGSLEVILKIVAALSEQSGASYVIVVHRKNDPDSILKALLTTRTTMPVKEVEDKEDVLPDTIYIAPPDYHLLFENDLIFSLDSSEKIHYSRPSIDVTFESAAEIFGSSVVGILLSGANADGAKGLKKIKQSGGLVIVQNPETAEVGFMPQQAVDLVKADAIIDGEQIGFLLKQFLESV